MNKNTTPKPASGQDAAAYYQPLFAPKTVAIVGASSSKEIIGNTFLRRIKDYGFKGDIYPIHPKADEINGFKAYPSLAETPKPVDYCYIAVGAAQVPDLVESGQGRIKFAHVISSGFGEVSEGVALQNQLVETAHKNNCRIIGPNSLGLYSPRGGITFVEESSKELGPVGIISQSGGLGTDIVARGQRRGVRFSGLVSVGNCADIGPTELLDFYLADPETKVIGAYLEQVKEGRKFFETLKASQGSKPVVILKGGRTEQGSRAAASHTGALAGNEQVWLALSKQTGCILADTLDEFLDILLAFQNLEPRTDRPSDRITLFGNGGGTSVLASDFYARRGLSIPPFDSKTVDALRALQLPPGTSIDNPVDAPVGTLRQEEGAIAEKIMDAVYAHSKPDALVMHLNMAAFRGRTPPSVMENLLQAAFRIQEKYPGQAHFLLALRSEGDPETEEIKRRFRKIALESNVPVFDELSNAAVALAALKFYETFKRDHVKA
ncbi:MAG: CoA-binding protein [Rhodospirillales bacterium]|jgi:acyl-CoA synthetase (NDP forming)